MNKLKICAISDLHGNLPEIKPSNVLFIAGDIIPYKYQNKISLSKEWLNDEFVNWINNLPVEKVYLIAGNHDFYFESVSNAKLLEFLNKMNGKLCYMHNSSAIYTSNSGKNYKIFGTPYCHQYGNWAFMGYDNFLTEKFKEIPDDVDFLITHDAPYGIKFQDVALELYKNLRIPDHIGNKPLLYRLMNIKYKWLFHGHIHSSDHNPTEFNGGNIVNVSILNEECELAYEPFYLEIEE